METHRYKVFGHNFGNLHLGGHLDFFKELSVFISDITMKQNCLILKMIKEENQTFQPIMISIPSIKKSNFLSKIEKFALVWFYIDIVID